MFIRDLLYEQSPLFAFKAQNFLLVGKYLPLVVTTFFLRDLTLPVL